MKPRGPNSAGVEPLELKPQPLVSPLELPNVMEYRYVDVALRPVPIPQPTVYELPVALCLYLKDSAVGTSIGPIGTAPVGMVNDVPALVGSAWLIAAGSD